MPLTDPACRNAACEAGKPRSRFSDSGGLYLEVAATGSKRWFWKYRLPGGTEKRLALGNYPAVPLKAARTARDDARVLLRQGTDPALQRKRQRLGAVVSAGSTFEAVARDFHRSKKAGWSEHYGKRWLERLEKDIFPWLGALAMSDIDAPLLLRTLRRVEGRGVRELAHSLREACGQVFRYGMATGVCRENPAPALRGALQPLNTRHMSAILEPKGAGELLRAIDGFDGQPTTRCALYLSALLFQRPGNIRAMEWSEIDLDAAMWAIPAAKMKRTVTAKVNGRPHLVPLPTQSVDLLRDELLPLTGGGLYVFPSMLSAKRCMSENTVNAALRRMGFTGEQMSAHGFRAMARTIMVERLNVHPDVIEAQLAHGKSGPLGMAYDRAEFVQQRRVMMQGWADYLDQLRAGAEVVPLKVA